jgi:sec-independent protein translocase protein TatB
MFAFVFDSVSGGEWLVLLAVILIIVGPKNLPSAARKVGEIMSKLRRAADEFKRQLMTMDEEMKKTADEIKKEYIDIPEDSSDRAITDISDGSDEPYDDYDPENPDYPGHYSDGYEEDYYGMDDSGPSMEESAGEDSASDAGSESLTEGVASAESEAASAPSTTETTEK